MFLILTQQFNVPAQLYSDCFRYVGKSYWSTKLDLQGSAFKRLQLFCCPLVIFMFLFLLFHCVSTFKYIQLLPSKSGFSIYIVMVVVQKLLFSIRWIWSIFFKVNMVNLPIFKIFRVIWALKILDPKWPKMTQNDQKYYCGLF